MQCGGPKAYAHVCTCTVIVRLARYVTRADYNYVSRTASGWKRAVVHVDKC